MEVRAWRTDTCKRNMGNSGVQDANRREDVFTFSVQRYDWLLRQLARVASDIA